MSAGEFDILGYKEPSSKRVKDIVEQDLADLKAKILSDASIEKTLGSDISPEVVNKLLIPKIIEEKYPNLSEQEREEIRQYVVVDSVLNGVELGGGSIRIHQDDVQEKMFEALGFTKEQVWERFGFLLTAFQYGVPPHAGLAYGLDRMIMLMLNTESIRDVIAFPKVKDASDLMTEAPTYVDEKQLEELGLEIMQDEK